MSSSFSIPLACETSDFALANLIKMDKEDPKTNNLRFEIAIACNKLSDGSSNEGKLTT